MQLSSFCLCKSVTFWAATLNHTFNLQILRARSKGEQFQLSVSGWPLAVGLSLLKSLGGGLLFIFFVKESTFFGVLGVCLLEVAMLAKLVVRIFFLGDLPDEEPLQASTCFNVFP